MKFQIRKLNRQDVAMLLIILNSSRARGKTDTSITKCDETTGTKLLRKCGVGAYVTFFIEDIKPRTFRCMLENGETHDEVPLFFGPQDVKLISRGESCHAYRLKWSTS